MATTIGVNSTEGQLTEEQRRVLERFISLSPAKQKRVFALGGLHSESSDASEKSEIEDAVAEILFPRPERLVAVPIDREVPTDSENRLEQHREYVGKQIKKWRHQLKMSQQDLAEKAGLPQSHISRLETGKHAPTYLTIEKVAEALGVKPSQIDLGFDD